MLKALLGAFACCSVLLLASWAAPRPQGTASAKAALPRQAAAPGATGQAPSSTFRFAVISDLNQSYGSTHYGSDVELAVAALAQRLRPELVLITGDMVAGQKRGVNAPAMWRAFHAAVTDPLQQAHIRVAPTPGNHDASPDFASERAEYVRQWSERQSGLSLVDGSHYPLRYSFTFRGALFVSLDAARGGPFEAEQREWVERQLASAPTAALKVVFGHLPLYPVAHGREREVITDRRLEAVFERYGVDLYVSGHHHAYYPGVTGSVRHLSMPCLGSGARPLIGTQPASAHALVLAQVMSGNIASLEALAAPTFSAPIARASLPPQIEYGALRLLRDDLAPGERVAHASEPAEPSQLVSRRAQHVDVAQHSD